MDIGVTYAYWLLWFGVSGIWEVTIWRGSCGLNPLAVVRPFFPHNAKVTGGLCTRRES